MTPTARTLPDNLNILGIDPGEKSSGYVVYSTKHGVLESSPDMPNYELVRMIANRAFSAIVCEKPAAMGQPLSGNLVETTIWAGAFWHASTTNHRQCWHWLTRNQVKVALCGTCRGVKDSHVACAVQERFGGRKAAVGTKKAPGRCYGVSSHSWQALAVVVAWLELQGEGVTVAAGCDEKQ